MKKGKTSCLKVIFTFFTFSIFICVDLSAQVASRTDGVNVFYYDSLFEALSAAADTAATNGTSIEQPDEITLLANVVLDEPLLIDDGVHIRLVAGSSDRTIHRSGNNIEYPVIWVRGEGASLCLGKPGMEHELVIDGGYLNSPPVEAHAPLATVSGPGAKLTMYDKVSLQNNINNGVVPIFSFYQNGAGVFVRTQDDIADRPAEFIMKGGTIRGNINDTQNVTPYGGGVLVFRIGIFTMEGGVIMNNTAYHSGGGVGYVLSVKSSFKKTGGIIYGSNDPAGYRNTALTGVGTPLCYGHAVSISAIFELFLRFRDDTVGENDNLSYTSDGQGIHIFGKGEKWDSHDKASLRILLAIVLPFLALVVGVFLILRKRTLKLMKIVQEAADQSAKANPKIDLENMDLSGREKDICELLLTDRTMKEIGQILGLTYSGANFHAQKLYVKLGIRGRTELLVRIKKE